MINCTMTVMLSLKSQLEHKLQKGVQKQGLTLEKLRLDDLEKRWFSDPLAQFSSVGLGESDLNGQDSKA